MYLESTSSHISYCFLLNDFCMHIEAYLLLIPTVYYNMTFDTFNRPWTNFYKMDLKNGFKKWILVLQKFWINGFHSKRIRSENGKLIWVLNDQFNKIKYIFTYKCPWSSRMESLCNFEFLENQKINFLTKNNLLS